MTSASVQKRAPRAVPLRWRLLAGQLNGSFAKRNPRSIVGGGPPADNPTHNTHASWLSPITPWPSGHNKPEHYSGWKPQLLLISFDFLPIAHNVLPRGSTAANGGKWLPREASR